MGRACALALAGAGADVAVAARTLGPLQEAAAEIEALGRKASATSFDAVRVQGFVC